jgi:lipopolysaccharide/colanic/teichoic acid biosynthesis glycosyltransferase
LAKEIAAVPRRGGDLRSGPWAPFGVKRALDLGVASVLALAILPLFVLIAVLTKLTSPGPLLFRQPCVGRNGALFTLYKVRTTRAGSALLRSSATDERGQVTRLGRLIRSLSLDGLPQLWNVIRGDMSLVGPRALPLEEALAYPESRRRHMTPPGFTGWWQINGRTAFTAEQASKMDQFYEENWSPSLDIYIALKTIAAAFKRPRWGER